MGDVLHALPAVAALRQARPELVLGWCVDPRWAPLLGTRAGPGPLVDHRHMADTRLWSRQPVSRATLRSLQALRRELREAGYGLSVDMQGTLRSAVIARLSGAPQIAGYRDPRERPAALAYHRRLSRQGVHVVDQGAALLGAAFGLSLQPLPAPLPAEPWAEAWADDLLQTQPACLLAASAGWGTKQWPVAHFAGLAKRLRACGFRVLTTAPRAGDPVTAEVAALSGGAAEVTVCDVAGLTALLRRMSLVIGGDTGPVHLAAMLGVPLVALFGPTDPARNGPWGPGPRRVLRHPASVTSYRHVAGVDAGLVQLTVESVLEAALAVLTEAEGRRPPKSGTTR